ncbi:MAG TPA: hypothetical protein DCP69_09080 [Candidatus Omnitrophica bacterium]|nr:hypothetical protein [Candidatus Omnitrophota bacterium]
MEHWKTKLGGGLAIAAGVLGYVVTFFGYSGLGWDAAMALISGGIVAIGLGDKFDKIKAILAAGKK